MDFTVEERKDVPSNRYFEIRYDQLVSNPSQTMTKVLQFCELERSNLFDRRVASVPVRNEDVKWKKELTARQIELLERCLSPHLTQHGFAI